MSNIIKGLNESLADEFMAMAKAKGYNPRLRGTPEQERERTNQMLAQRAKDREMNPPQKPTLSPEQIEQLKQSLAQEKQGFDPNYEYSDDHSYWTTQKEKAQRIGRIEQQLKDAGAELEEGVSVNPTVSQEKQQAISAYQQVKKLVDQLDYRNKQRVVSTLKKDLQLAESGTELTESEVMMELSPQTLASYKKKAGADATAADKAGDYERGNKRFSGIVKATKKEFDNDAKGVNKEDVAEGSNDKPEAGDKIVWYHSNHHPKLEGEVVGWKDGHLIVKSIDPSPRNTEKTVATYRVPKNNILSVEKQGVEEGDVSHLHKALDRALSKEKKVSPVQVQRNKERWAQRQAEKNKEVDEGYDKWGWHTSVTNGEFMPTKYGNKAYVYLHDMDNQSANGNPQLVTVNKPTIAKKLAQQFGAKVVKTDLNTYRIVKPAEQGNEDMKIDELAINEDWQKVNKKDKTDGMSRKAVKAYRRENPGSKLKTAVTTKPSKLKKGSKAAKRRKSFCARMSGMKKAHASAKTKRDPDSPINKALRRWNCESVEQMQELIMIAEAKIAEAKNAKQQAAIAIAKKAAKKG